ncbi:MAG TPA: putative porin [Pyrinomonadaceae bacterium]
MPQIMRSTLPAIASVILLCVWASTRTRAQEVSSSPHGDVVSANTPTARADANVPPKRASDSERIVALEETLRQQGEQLEQLRLLIAEQSKLINELRTNGTVTRPITTTEREGTMAHAEPQQTPVEQRLGVVEAQAKKTSESLNRQLGSITFSGDLRLRFESFFGLSNTLANASNPGVLGNDLSPRFRPRIRARLALRGVINDEFDWGLRFATGSFADNISTNQTLTDFYNRKTFALDQAYITYKSKHLRGLRIQGGKFEPPWTYTEMTFDNDLQVEGLNESYSRDFKGKLKNVALIAWQLPMLERNSAFVRNADGTVNVEQSRRGGRDLALYGAQIRARFEPTEKIALTLSVADHYFAGTHFISPVQVFGSQLQLPVTITLPATPTTPAQTITTQVSIPRDLLVAGNGNLGLTTASNNATNRDGRLSSGFNLVDILGRVDFKHSNRFPVSIILNVVRNTQVHDVVVAGPGGTNRVLPNNEDTGVWAEVQVGKTRERGDLQFGYTFMGIEKDAVLTPFNFSDITQQSDINAHRFNFAYSVDPRVTFSVIGIVTQRRNGVLGAFGVTPPGSFNRASTRLQFDTMFRF